MLVMDKGSQTWSFEIFFTFQIFLNSLIVNGPNWLHQFHSPHEYVTITVTNYKSNIFNFLPNNESSLLITPRIAEDDKIKCNIYNVQIKIIRC